MNLISKILEYKYRVITLDGDITYAGGMISGGSSNKMGISSYKTKLIDSKKRLDDVIKLLDKKNNEMNDVINDINNINDKLSISVSELFKLNSIKDSKLNIVKDEENRLNIIKSDINSLNNKDNKIDDQINDLMNKLNELNIEKNKIEAYISDQNNKKDSLKEKLEIEEENVSNANSEYKKNATRLNEVSNNIGRINAKLDNLLLYLNEEYNMTYEYTKDNYELVGDESVIRSKVRKLKQEIKSLGEVNVGSIKEYERLSERYNFLTSQKQDLEISMNDLYKIIDDMDNIMKDRFKDTFDKVKDEFSKVFKIMFQGGSGKLVLTDPEDYLNTGIDMIISPPGKKINNTQSLSGGEKSLTAICLLFAILNVSVVPFIILDEVEAALDEVNVDLFGEYLNTKKNDSQYILVTHKKRMMEYADILYGITMQNAGISKVVGVKLEQ